MTVDYLLSVMAGETFEDAGPRMLRMSSEATTRPRDNNEGKIEDGGRSGR